ncbi:VENN motif pre-toxin domain-containing protein [Histophilus somni]|uniref:VENN motif pre-toxin domain-containing protein n=1 Tax=Histophilus somni TaxID=731 RepID=UPI003877B79E
MARLENSCYRGKLALGKAKAQNASEKEIVKLTQRLNDLQKAYDKAYGTGSTTKRAVDAVTAALQGLAAKDAGQAVVGLASPYLNAQIKRHTENADGSVNTEANLLAHAILGAVEATITGNNALAGAAAGAGGEAAAMFITHTLYPNKKPNQLTEAEKKNITFLSQLAGGLASGLVGDSTQAVALGGDIAKRAVENNALDASQSVDYLKELSDAIAQGKSLNEINEKYKAISQAEFEKDLQACNQQGLMCYVGTLMAMDAGVKSAEGYKNFHPLPPDIQAQALDFIRNEAARHSIELVDGSPTMIQLALMAIEVGQEMYEAKNAGRSFATDRAQANFAKKVKYSAPIAKPTAKVVSEKNIKTLDGRVLSYSSNIKHVNGKDPNAGLEPNNVIELFKNSVPSTKYDAKKDVRYSVDSKGNIHRFFGDKNTLEFHWSGSTNDISNPLNENHIPNEVKKKLRGSK